jgi:hypothetical protein
LFVAEAMMRIGSLWSRAVAMVYANDLVSFLLSYHELLLFSITLNGRHIGVGKENAMIGAV